MSQLGRQHAQQVLPLKQKLPVTPIPHSLNTTLCPTLHSVMTDMSQHGNISGMMWPEHAAFGNSGRSSSCEWVKVSLEPYGIVTVIRFLATEMPVADASVTRKWLVAPESNIA